MARGFRARGPLVLAPAGPPPPTHSVAYDNFIARTSGLDTTHLNAYADLLDGLTADGLFNTDGSSSFLDDLYILATQDATTASLNLVSSSFTITLVSTPTFTNDQGYKGLDGSHYLNTNFNGSTGVNYSQNSASIGVWCYDAPANGAYIHVASGAGGQNVYPNQGATYFRINETTESGGFSTSFAAGFYFGNRSSSTGREGYLNGSSIGTYGTVNSTAPANSNYVIGRDVSSTTKTISGVVFGGSLNSILAGNLNSRLRTYMTAVGVP